MNMTKLDLHGVRHEAVTVTVMEFVYLNQQDVPLQIIAGNSEKMIELVEQTFNQIGIEIWEQTRYGVFVVRKL
jgi:hypothetical protein|tara:strand:+ start:1416 stop:1634 length:219 start_codon:yes stop_codon:yes gene_type:complete